MDIPFLINIFSSSYFGLNWLDILIAAIIIFYVIEGYSLGFLLASIDFISFVLSFILGIAFYGKIAILLIAFFKISQGFANAIGFFLAVAMFEVILNLTLRSLSSGIPLLNKELKNKKMQTINHFGGVVPGALSGLILASFIVSLLISLPFSIFLKKSVNNSQIGNVLAANTQNFSKNWNTIFGGAINDTLTFLTVEPEGNQTVDLHFKVSKTKVDLKAEQEMLRLVNQQRNNQGLERLVFSEDLARVGRNYCKEMFNRGYFSHYTPEGLSPFDRMQEVSINFGYAGENLALAPNVSLAMNGLMNSPGHRANILSPNFKKIGIGVIDGGVYGQMYCQEFTD